MIRSRFLPLIAGLVIVLSGCNSDALPPAGQYATLSGVVTDSVTHAPIQGATVTVDAVLTTTTDANGAFSFAKVPIGALDFTVQADGHKLSSGSVKVEGSKPFVLNVALETAQPGS